MNSGFKRNDALIDKLFLTLEGNGNEGIKTTVAFHDKFIKTLEEKLQHNSLRWYDIMPNILQTILAAGIIYLIFR